MTEWEADCLRWHKRVLTGKFCHWCDELPIDETCAEFAVCLCFDTETRRALIGD